MKISFLGHVSAFDYFQIGGSETLVRRLASALSELPEIDTVSYVLFGHTHNETHRIVSNKFILRYCTDFHLALSHLANQDVIVTIYLPKSYSMTYYRYRLQKKFRSSNRPMFLLMVQGSPQRLRNMAMLLAALSPFSLYSKILTISEKVRRMAAVFAKPALLFLPPISDMYFDQESKRNGKASLPTAGFLGRNDIEKGIDLVQELFEQLTEKSISKTLISSYTIRDQTDTQVNVPNDVEVLHRGYDETTERDVCNILGELDYLVLPYRSVHRTINPPLLVLEGMARGCIVITTLTGELSRIHRAIPFVLSEKNFVKKAVSIIENRKDEAVLMSVENAREEFLNLRCRATDVAKDIVAFISS
jgi:glycosyltransferase involved in cell wall biosynthesis